MQLRSGRTTLIAPPPRLGVGDGDGEEMNASLWGELQIFVDLSLIYAKLPLGPFFRLRLVCREWNRLASDRQFLEHNFKPPMSNLYFVVARRAGHRLWTFQDSSWTSSPVPRRRCEMSGLLYEDSDRHRVFDLHTRVFYSLPPLPSGRLTKDANVVVGIMVDTALIPYGFRFLIHQDCGTSIYDSNSATWTTTTSTSSDLLWFKLAKFSNVLSSNVLYMWTKLFGGCCQLVHTYDFKKHEWGFELFGVPHCIGWVDGGIGVWRDHWFTFRWKPEWDFVVWEMNTNSPNSWIEFDCMPKELCEWMLGGRGHQSVFTTFCGEHVLVYDSFEAQERAILYNLDRKTWAKIDVQKKYKFQK